MKRDAKGADGAGLRDHIEQLCKQTGKTRKELGLSGDDDDDDDIPQAGRHLWDWFWELHQGRGSNGFSPNPISWTELDAWARRFGLDLNPFELCALKSMDRAYLAACAERGKR